MLEAQIRKVFSEWGKQFPLLSPQRLPGLLIVCSMFSADFNPKLLQWISVTIDTSLVSILLIPTSLHVPPFPSLWTDVGILEQVLDSNKWPFTNKWKWWKQCSYFFAFLIDLTFVSRKSQERNPFWWQRPTRSLLTAYSFQLYLSENCCSNYCSTEQVHHILCKETLLDICPKFAFHNMEQAFLLCCPAASDNNI